MKHQSRRRKTRSLAGGAGYRICNRLFHAAVRAVDPRVATVRALRLSGDALTVGATHVDLSAVRNVYVIGFGKAAATMAQGVEAVLGDRITAGAVVTKYGHTVPTRRVAVYEAAHPTPDAASIEATATVLRLVADVTADDLVICLVSGGGSALFEQPAAGLMLADMQETTHVLLRAGAPITALNTVRKHLSAVKGGQLARRIAPAKLIALILSDVTGEALDVIASGPTVPDPTTFADALAVLDAYAARAVVPDAVRNLLESGVRGGHPDTPKIGDPCFATTSTQIIADAQVALDAAAHAAEELGLPTIILSNSLEGESRDVARVWASIARQARSYAQPLAPPCCLLAGGETTVTVRGEGIGGRNCEFALAAAQAIDGTKGIVVASLATDGGDGPTDAAGAVATSATVGNARFLGVDPTAALMRNDAYTFFARVGGLYRPGPTGTNVNDLIIALIE
jgi:glycerate 2-kinase